MEWWSIEKFQIPSTKFRLLGVPPEADQVSGVRKKKNRG
jgi:hypothetical protein